MRDGGANRQRAAENPWAVVAHEQRRDTVEIARSARGLRRVGVLAVGLAAVAAAGAATPSPAAAAPVEQTTAAMSDPWDASGFVQWRGEGIWIRACASTSCTVLGLGYSSHTAGWYCGEVSNGFAHIYDFTTAVDGWVSTSWIYYGCD